MVDTYKIRGTKIEVPYPVKLTPGETRLIFSLQRHFAPERIMVDVYLPRPEVERVGDFVQVSPLDARLTQIDCIAVNELGVFVIESKDLSGWIYGDFAQKKWTQTLDYGREKNAFYNPFLQNRAHVEAVRSLVGDEAPLVSVVVFGNNVVLKTLKSAPTGNYYCLQSGIYELMTRIKGEMQVSLSNEKILGICELLGRGRIIPSAKTVATHIDEVGRVKRQSSSHF